MHILLVNDDGIDSAGLQRLAESLAKGHQVTVVAPDRERSAVGHGITLREPLLVREVFLTQGVEAYALSGTPADCTRVGLDALAAGPVDLVVSGPNRGYNIGMDLFYSGTVSAAMEAAMQGVKAIAVSAAPEADAGETVKVFLRVLQQIDPKRDIRQVLNVNIPALPLERIVGVRWVPQALSFPWKDRYERRTSPSGQEYYWVHGSGNPLPPGEATDLSEITKGFVTLTPLTFRLTDEEGFCRKEIVLK